MRKLLFLAMMFVLAACGGSATPATVPAVGEAPTPAASAPAATSAPAAVTLDVVISPAPETCGPEAAITFAQTQSDLALAALALADGAAEQRGSVGVMAFAEAHRMLSNYRVPDCLAVARTQGLTFMQARIAGYQALANSDQQQFEYYLTEGEAARQAMLGEIEAVLAQQ